jgi:hypothetical protein
MQELAEKLYNAGGHEEVSRLLKQFGYLSSEEDWKPLGGSKGTRSSVVSQSGRSIVPIVELVYNGYDAVAMKSYFDKKPPREPSTLDEVFSELVEDERIELRISGGEDRPNICVFDTGVGQRPEEFEETFLDTEDPGLQKDNFDFIQGHFGLGSTGCFKNAGGGDTYGKYKLVVSCSYDDEGTWGWSIVRRNKNTECFEYLAPEGNIPQFKDTFQGEAQGSFVKVYSYEISNMGTGSGSFTNAHNKFNRRLERIMFNPPSNLRIVDERNELKEKNRYETYIARGHRHYLDKEYNHLVREHVSVNKKYDIRGLGRAEVDIYILYDDPEDVLDRDLTIKEKNKRFLRERDMPVVYLVNGQMHGREPYYFINKCGLEQIGLDMVISVDFSNSPITDNFFEMSDVFHATRDRLEHDIKKDVQDKTKEAVDSQKIIRKIDDERIEKSVSSEEKEADEEVFRDFLESYPDVLDYIQSGDDMRVDNVSSEITGESTTRPEFDLEEPPSTIAPVVRERWSEDLKPVIYEEDESYEIGVETKSESAKIKIWLDAPDYYINMLEDYSNIFPKLELVGNYELYESATLNNGIFSLNIDVSDIVNNIGDRKEIEVMITTAERERLSTSVTLVGKESEKTTHNEDTSGEVELPEIRRISEEEWDEYGFTSDDVLKYRTRGDRKDLSQHELLVNVDCEAHKHFKKEHEISADYQVEVQDRFCNAIGIYAISSYREVSDNFDEDEYEYDVTNIVEDMCRGIANVIFTTMYDESELRRITK